MVSRPVPERLTPFVKDILILNGGAGNHRLPFYADGFPGIMFSETQTPITLMPYDKELSDFFLYGQTIDPIELQLSGRFEIIVFQLYPFATRLFLDIDPKAINDACYDLENLKEINPLPFAKRLREATADGRCKIIEEYLLAALANSSRSMDNAIKLAVSMMLNRKGQVSIKEVRDALYITERTFERRFADEIGVTPKQFARIVQFDSSFMQLKGSEYESLTELAFENGYADQSHFIRSFKRFTGSTPKELLKQHPE